jgi:hypothetical protein
MSAVIKQNSGKALAVIIRGTITCKNQVSKLEVVVSAVCTSLPDP